MMIVTKQSLVMMMLVLVIQKTVGQRTYNVLDFHAAADGKTDDSKAFLAAWKAACSEVNRPILLIPGGRTLLLSQITFEGPCKSPFLVQLDGTIMAPKSIWTSEAANFLTFYSIDNLTLDGTGQIDGQGSIWWTCFNQKRCNSRPVLLAFTFCNNLWVRRIRLKNSADKHMTLFQCKEVHVHMITITAPGDSPNTDGITMGLSHNVSITSCTIQAGDDCVSILSGSTDVHISQSTCGPGHGISVGSLGGSGSTAMVERITVSNCSFFQTMTGVRIKSWQGGKGNAKGFLFEHINMTAVQNPIVIDQFYCPQGNCPTKGGGVAISDARFVSIYGTSSEQEAIKILCSQSVPCQGIYFNNVNLSWEGHNAPANATTLNAYGTSVGTVVPKIKFSNS